MSKNRKSHGYGHRPRPGWLVYVNGEPLRDSGGRLQRWPEHWQACDVARTHAGPGMIVTVKHD